MMESPRSGLRVGGRLTGLLAFVGALVSAWSLLGSGIAVAADQRVDANARWEAATPEMRRAYREVARERWEQASRKERRTYRRAVRGLRHVLPGFSDVERQLLLRRIFSMPKSEQDEVRRRLRAMDDLEGTERQHFVAELHKLAEWPAEQVEKFERNLDRWKTMSESDRDRYRSQMRRFRELPIEDRKRLLDEWVEPDAKQSR